MLFVVCCLLFVVCCLLFVVCCLLFVVCCLLFVVCCLLFVVCLEVILVLISKPYLGGLWFGWGLDTTFFSPHPISSSYTKPFLLLLTLPFPSFSLRPFELTLKDLKILAVTAKKNQKKTKKKKNQVVSMHSHNKPNLYGFSMSRYLYGKPIQMSFPRKTATRLFSKPLATSSFYLMC